MVLHRFRVLKKVVSSSANGPITTSLSSPTTLSDWLQNHRANRPDQIALECGDLRVTFAELSARVKRVAEGLSGIGIRRGAIVGLQLPNGVEFVVCYLAICKLGGVVQMLHLPYRRTELRYLLNDAKASAVICLSRFKDYSPAEIMLSIADDEVSELRVITVGKAVARTHSLDALPPTDNLNPEVTPSPDWPFVLLYTSGTTAEPKGVVHRYNRFLGNATTAASELQVTRSAKVLSLAAFSHLYGLFTLNMALAVGATTVLLPTFTPGSFKQALVESEPTAVFAAPAHFLASTADGLVSADHLACVNLVCLSGSTVPADLAKAVDAMLTDGVVVQLWGMTELQAGTYARPADPPAVRLQTAGRPSPGTRLRVVDEAGQVLAAGEQGVLQVRGASLFAEYLRKPDESARAFSDDGWFDTGDLAILDAQSCLVITGRVKELINRGGVKYNPIEIEEIIGKLPQVQSCAIASVEDEVLGEVACLYVVLASQATLALEDVRQCLQSAEVAKYKWPEQIAVLSAMPLTATNKIARAKLSGFVTS